MTKRKLAFSVLEIAVLLIIISLITVGIMRGTSIVRSARLSSARSLTVKSHISEIPGMIAWYENSLLESFSQDQATTTAQLTEWRDTSPDSIAAQKNKLTRSASSSVTYQSDGINNLPSVQFISSGSLALSLFAQGNLGQGTLFAVIRPAIAPSGTVMHIVDSSTSAAGTSAFGITNNQVSIDLGSGQSTGTTTNAASFVENSDYILAVYYNGANSKAFVNDADTMAGGSAISAGNNSLDGLTIGNNRSLSKPFIGLISEIIVYNRPLSIEERKSVMSYLSKKYKIRVVGT